MPDIETSPPTGVQFSSTPPIDSSNTLNPGIVYAATATIDINVRVLNNMLVGISVANINIKGVIIDSGVEIPGLLFESNSGHIDFPSRQNVSFSNLITSTFSITAESAATNKAIQLFAKNCVASPKIPLRIQYDIVIESTLLSLFNIRPSKRGIYSVDCPAIGLTGFNSLSR